MPKREYTKVTSPISTAAYAWLASPDEGQEFSDGKFKVTGLLEKDSPDTKTFLKKMKALCDEAAEGEFNGKPKSLRYPWKDGDEKDKEDFHGMWMLTAKTKYRPSMVDCSKPIKVLPEGSEPKSGDLIRMSIKLIPYQVGGAKGVAAQLQAVQLVEKRNLSNAGTDDFDSIDGGYSADDAVEDDDELE